MLPTLTRSALRWRPLQLPGRAAGGFARWLATQSAQPLVPHRVSSASSSTFKRLLALSKQPTGLVPPASLLAEGRTLIQHLANSPWQLARLILTEHTLSKELERKGAGEPHLLQLLSRAANEAAGHLLLLPAPLARRLSHATTPSEYMAEFVLPAAAITRPLLSGDTVVVDGVSDPTNLASLMRSAHAFGFHQLALRHGSCSPYRHKVVAGSAGSIAFVGVRQWSDEVEREVQRIRAGGRVCVVGLVASGGRPLRAVAERVMRRRAEGACVWLVVGNESRGLSGDMLAGCDELCTIPTSSDVESLNAAVAASIACYELGRAISADKHDRSKR